MKRVLLALGGIALVALLAVVVALNPVPVDFRATPTLTIRPMLGVLLIITFCAGAAAVLLGGALRHMALALWTRRTRRDARAAAQAANWHEEGESAAWRGEMERSRALLRKAWQRQPGNGAAALALASSYLDTGEYAAAQEVLQAALEENPDDPDLRYALGEALRRRGALAEAIRTLEGLRARYPGAPRVLISLRELYREAERWQDAADVQAVYVDRLAASARAEEHQRLVAFRYQVALELQDPTARVAALDALLQEARDFVPAAVSLGDALTAAGRGEEARKVWEKTLRSHPRLVLLERLLAADASGRTHERALALVGKQVDMQGDGAHLLLAREALAADDLETAERELRAVTTQDAPTVLRVWAELYERRGDHGAAWSALARAADELGAAAADHRCTACGRRSETWVGYCRGCGEFDSYRAVIGNDLSSDR
ncbi:MAG: tetratricopeptide repeat protein [Candidatus Binatia bacterium]